MRAWLYRVARNLALDELRRRKRIGSAPAHREDVAEADASHDHSAVQRALEILSPDDRELLYLADVDGLSSQEIADLYGIRAGTARTRLSRAHVRFRAAYEAQR
jgi:RNA polymerase sigma-70 factor (ECF subfamily)